MADSNQVKKYPLGLRLVHWVSALTIIFLLVVGIYMADLDPDAANKYDFYPIHQSFGILAMVLITARIFFRKKGPIPAPATGLKQWELMLSKWAHRLLYLCMVLMPLSGYLMTSTYAYSDGIDMFGLFTVPDITSKSELWTGVFHQVHSLTSWLLVFILAAHVLGVIKHKLFDGKESDVLSRMV
ncbi:cytochrome b [Marinomonas sp. PE14-40]|uniref:cytochrome b n=1 Tax=Marinomonas sp. PE14-40 TaxID=3060621 RepID=UPI003F679EEB